MKVYHYDYLFYFLLLNKYMQPCLCQPFLTFQMAVAFLFFLRPSQVYWLRQPYLKKKKNRKKEEKKGSLVIKQNQQISQKTKKLATML